MKLILIIALFSLLLALAIRAYAAQVVNIGEPAPEFSLVNQHGETVKLSDYQGKWVVLYFYPKNNTPGCTKEACSFRDDISAFEKLHVQVLGLSIDNQTSHANFASKYKLPFPLLADADGKVAEAYGAMTNLYLVKLAKRYTYVIDPTGKVAKVYTNVNPKEHAKQLLEDLKNLI